MKLRYKIASGVLIFFVIGFTALAIVLSHDSACGPSPVIADDARTMKSAIYRCYGSSEVIEYVDVVKPSPADNEVLVRVHAASVNPLDWHFMRGSPYFMRLGTGLGAPKDNRLGVDLAGTVEEVGSKVSKFKPGDQIFGGGNGAFAEYLTVREDKALAFKPASMTFQQAASVPIAGITALQALRDLGQLKAGQKVLINGASGGVGTFAVQIAKSLGAEVTGVCSTRNVEMVRSLGADHVIDYKKENYTENGQKYDLILDNVGNHSLSANRDVLGPESIFVIVGGPKGDWLGPILHPIKAMLLSPFVSQEFVMILAKIRSDDLAILADLMAAGKVTPVIDRAYALSDLPSAIQYSEEGHARGKIIINVD